MDKRVIPNEILLEEIGRMLEEGREVVFRPKGNSMLPFIRGDRDSVVLRKQENVEVGDIILVRLDGRYVLHRLIRKEGDALTLMGDGNVRGTEACTVGDVMGTVTAIVRENGKTVKPGKGTLWRALKPLRRYILAIYRRI